MSLEDRLKKTRDRLVLEHPLLGALSSFLKFTSSDDIATFSSKQKEYIYNKEYIKNLNDDELLFTLANASLHQSQAYQSRRKRRNKWLWDLAVDYTINSILIQNNLFPPPDINYEKGFDGMYAEQIYEELRLRFKDEEQNDDSDQEKESHEKTHEQNSKKIELSKDEEKELSNLIETIIKRYQDSDKLKGLDRIVDIKGESKLNWREILFRYINSHAYSDYRFLPPNKKFLYQGLALPSVYGQRLEIAIAIDTSASIDKEMLDSFLQEVQTIMNSFDNYEILLIECDNKIQNIQNIHNYQKINTTLKGGGATDFRVVFIF